MRQDGVTTEKEYIFADQPDIDGKQAINQMFIGMSTMPQFEVNAAVSYSTGMPSEKLIGLGPTELRVDGPLDLGAFLIKFMDILGNPKSSAKMNSISCAVECKASSQRIIVLTFSGICHCLDYLPYNISRPIFENPIESEKDHWVRLFMTECETGWTRIADKCYKVIQATNYQDAEDLCLNEDSHLFWPESLHEASWIHNTMGQGLPYLFFGFQTLSTEGYVAMDYSDLVGIPFLTHFPDGNDTYNYNSNKEQCWRWKSQDNKLKFGPAHCTTPGDTVAVCKKHLVDGFGHFNLVGDLNASYTVWCSDRDSEQETLSTHLETGITWKSSHKKFSKYQFLQINFESRVLVSGIRVTTTEKNALKTFNLRVNIDPNMPNDLVDTLPNNLVSCIIVLNLIERFIS